MNWGVRSFHLIAHVAAACTASIKAGATLGATLLATQAMPTEASITPTLVVGQLPNQDLAAEADALPPRD